MIPIDGKVAEIEVAPPGQKTNGRPAFVIGIDAQALATLIVDARHDLRLYELWSLDRPGDLLHYLRVHAIGLSKELMQRFTGKRSTSAPVQDAWSDHTMPLLAFDGLFSWNPEDDDATVAWQAFRSGNEMRSALSSLLAWLFDERAKIFAAAGFLGRHEISRIEDGSHPRHFAPERPRLLRLEPTDVTRDRLPECVIDEVRRLIKLETVQSVSAPFADFRLWRSLIEEQLRRSQHSPYPPQQTFTLSGPDSGLWPVPWQDWGGEVHIPYEGAVLGDLFIKPAWRNAFPEHDADDASLNQIFSFCPAAGMTCHYVITSSDLGLLKCAERKPLGEGWVLYESRLPYSPNRFEKPHLGDWLT